jgi:hypothetical protein
MASQLANSLVELGCFLFLAQGHAKNHCSQNPDWWWIPLMMTSFMPLSTMRVTERRGGAMASRNQFDAKGGSGQEAQLCSRQLLWAKQELHGIATCKFTCQVGLLSLFGTGPRKKSLQQDVQCSEARTQKTECLHMEQVLKVLHEQDHVNALRV